MGGRVLGVGLGFYHIRQHTTTCGQAVVGECLRILWGRAVEPVAPLMEEGMGIFGVPLG